ncbi:MAG: patatin-like phospholipase family protein, partial [Terracidiphilus sp.]
ASRPMPQMWNKAARMRRSVSKAKGCPSSELPVRIGLALGGGFARGIAHAGVLRVLEQHHIPIHCVTGISAGAIVAAAYASGATTEEIVRAGCSLRFGDVGSFRPCRLGLIGSQAMRGFLERLLKSYRFEEMRIALGVLATDLATGDPVPFAESGEVFEPIRASCAYPGLFQPVSHRGSLLVDGAMSMGIPAALARQLGATHVISVSFPPAAPGAVPDTIFQVVSRCFQILQSRCENSWRGESDLVIAPDVRGVDWNAFGRGPQLVQAGEAAAAAVISKIQEWCSTRAAAAPFLRMEMAS